MTDEVTAATIIEAARKKWPDVFWIRIRQQKTWHRTQVGPTDRATITMSTPIECDDREYNAPTLPALLAQIEAADGKGEPNAR